MFLLGIAGAQLLRAFHQQEPHHAGIAVSHSQDGSVVAVWKGGRFPRRALALVFPLENALSDMVRYLELNADSMPNYGKRYRAGQRISTGFVESAVNEIVAKRMVKKQQMRWNRHTVQSFLDVRIHVLNGTLENAFRQWHQGFRPIADRSQVPVAA
jgi:hypothetical protein